MCILKGPLPDTRNALESERCVYAAVAGFGSMLPPEVGVPWGTCQMHMVSAGRVNAALLSVALLVSVMFPTYAHAPLPVEFFLAFPRALRQKECAATQ